MTTAAKFVLPDLLVGWVREGAFMGGVGKVERVLNVQFHVQRRRGRRSPLGRRPVMERLPHESARP